MLLAVVVGVRLLQAARDQEHAPASASATAEHHVEAHQFYWLFKYPDGRRDRQRAHRAGGPGREPRRRRRSRRRAQLVGPRVRRQDRRDPRQDEPHVVQGGEGRQRTSIRCAEFCGHPAHRDDTASSRSCRTARPRATSSVGQAGVRGRVRLVPRPGRRGAGRPGDRDQPDAAGSEGARTAASRTARARCRPSARRGTPSSINALVGYLKTRFGGHRWRLSTERVPLRPAWYEGRFAQLARHDRPQADRHALHLDEPALLRRRRHPRAADAQPARDGERGLHHARQLQRAVHDPRHGDGLPRRRSDPRRLRQLPRAADDRRARRRVPAAERDVVLVLPLRRPDALPQLLRRRRRGEVRLDVLRAALGDPVLARDTASTSGSCRCTC